MAMDAENFRSMVRQTAQADENEEEILTGVQLLAEERARRLSRPSTSEDVEYFLSMFCWNPLKPDPPETVRAELQFLRQKAFGPPQTDQSRADWLSSFVRGEAFTWTRSELYDAQQDGVKRFLRPPDTTGTAPRIIGVLTVITALIRRRGRRQSSR
jgi:hypothetical protein